MTSSDAVLQLACAVLVLGLPLGVAVVAPPPRVALLPLVAGSVVAALAVPAWAVVLGLSPDPAARLLDTALLGGVAFVLGRAAAARIGGVGAGVLAALTGAVLLAPLLLALVGIVPGVLQQAIGAVDFAGVLATHVAVAVTVGVMQALTGRPPGPIGADPGSPAPARTALAVVLVAIAATGWMLGAERLVTDASGRTALNAGSGALLGAAVWLIIAVLAGRERPAGGAVLGALLGWGAVGAGAPYLSPMAVAAAVALGVSAGAAIVLRRRPGASASGRTAVAMIVAVTIGGVMTALLADGFGLAATGSIAGVIAHIGAVLAISALAAPLAAIIIAVTLLVSRRPFRWAIPDSN